ncbi:MAG: tail fiber protein [Actinomycetota bacterium]|nr:tail fiber protein [Actinomycetota bacterium]
MASPYIGEIRMFAGNFAPQGWATCDGQLIAISENDTLFNLIGTTYGGDGQSTFGLPNLAARLPIHIGNNGTSTYNLADNGGVTSVTLTTNQMPNHTHQVIADSGAASSTVPTNAYFASVSGKLLYTVPNDPNNPQGPNFKNMNAGMLPVQGGSQPHDNMQPYLAITFIISLYGIYPSPT